MFCLPSSFGILNWSIVVIFLAGTAVVGHLARGRGRGLKDFFLGNKAIPWWAASLSIIASQTSGMTLIAVPAAVFMAGGNVGYGQMMIGVFIGKILMVFLFVGPFFEEVIYSPYEFISKRLGNRSGQLARVLFLISAVLSQGVRLFATALVLSEVTGLSGRNCIFILGAFSAVHCVMGGISTVIWTDVIQFAVFFLGGLFLLFWMFNDIPFGLGEAMAILDEKAKLILIDWSVNPKNGFSIWVALLAFSVYELGLNSTDQVVTQRLMCCRNQRDARKAVLMSCVSVLMAFMMLAVGLGLVLHYFASPLSTEAATRISQEPDRIFPYYLIHHIPAGLSGLIMAAVFAAGISTLDSALAALSQTSVMGIYRTHVRKNATETHYVFAAKAAVIFWALVLSLLAILFESMGHTLLELLFVVPGYVNGPLLGIGLLALMRRGNWKGIAVGACCAVGCVLALQRLDIHIFWAYPVGTAVVVGVGLLLSRNSKQIELRE